MTPFLTGISKAMWRKVTSCRVRQWSVSSQTDNTTNLSNHFKLYLPPKWLCGKHKKCEHSRVRPLLICCYWTMYAIFLCPCAKVVRTVHDCIPTLVSKVGLLFYVVPHLSYSWVKMVFILFLVVFFSWIKKKIETLFSLIFSIDALKWSIKKTYDINRKSKTQLQ